MARSNRNWLPRYCDPESFLPKVQETRALFSRPPYVFSDFVGKAFSLLTSAQIEKTGFRFDPKRTLPCKWRCADESLYGVDLAIYAQTGQYPFDKGRIGGFFNGPAVNAAVHHGPINVDFGGSHVGYVPGEGGGSFGHIWRPQQGEHSTNCGHVMSIIEPFRREYEDACENILIYKPAGGEPVCSVPNEFVQPNWSIRPIKLLIDTETLTAGEVEFQHDKPHTHTPIGRTLFYVSKEALARFPREMVMRLAAGEKTPIGPHLTHHFFNIYDVRAALGEDGLPHERLLLYMKFILSAKHSAPGLKAAIINTNLEHNRLADVLRTAAFTPYSFASFTGVFIDLYDQELGSYFNLFQPLGLNIKPSGSMRTIEFTPEEVHAQFDGLKPTSPVLAFREVMRFDADARLLQKFTYRPGRFRQELN